MLSNLIESIKTSIFSNDFFGGAFWLTILGSIFYSIRNIPVLLFNIIKKHILYTVYFDETDELFYFFEKWLDTHYQKKYRIVEISLKFNGDAEEPKSNKNNEKHQDKNQDRKIQRKQFADTFFIKYKNKFLHISKGRLKLENANSLRSAFLNHYQIKGIRSKKIIHEMLDEVVKYNTVEDDSTSIFNNSEYGEWYFTSKKELRPERSVVINHDIKNKLYSSIDKFLINKTWYKEKGISYKYGILLYGPPENGKSSLIQTISRKYLMDIYYMDLHGKDLNDFRLRKLFQDVKEGSLLVVEDIDTFFKDKRTLSTKGLSFSCFLNCIDGLNSKEGIITIFTTNKKIELDEALLRPGRIDLVLEIPKPTVNEVKEYYKVFFNEELNISDLRNGHTMAEVQDIFLKNLDSKERITELIAK